LQCTSQTKNTAILFPTGSSDPLRELSLKRPCAHDQENAAQIQNKKIPSIQNKNSSNLK
jgi:hypothetical protein